MRTSMTLLMCVVLALGGAAGAEMVRGEVTPIPHPALMVTGQSVVEVETDTARVTASIITEGDTVEAARERNAQIARAATAAVKALNLPNATTKTLNYTMERVTRDAGVHIKVDLDKWDLPWKVRAMDVTSSDFRVTFPVILGYRAANSLTVRLQGTPEELSEGSGKVVDALMAAGCNQITSVEYLLEKGRGEAVREALAEAVREAQMTGEAVAGAAGRKIVGIRSITPSYRYAAPDPRYRAAAAMSAVGRADYGEAATPTAVTAGTLQVTATVQVTYDLDYNPGDTELLAR